MTGVTVHVKLTCIRDLPSWGVVADADGVSVDLAEDLQVTIALDLTSLLGAIKSIDEPIEVQLECVSDACPSLRLHKIGLGQGL